MCEKVETMLYIWISIDFLLDKYIFFSFSSFFFFSETQQSDRTMLEKTDILQREYGKFFILRYFENELRIFNNFQQLWILREIIIIWLVQRLFMPDPVFYTCDFYISYHCPHFTSAYSIYFTSFMVT